MDSGGWKQRSDKKEGILVKLILLNFLKMIRSLCFKRTILYKESVITTRNSVANFKIASGNEDSFEFLIVN